MKAPNKTALKLLLILALACVYSFISVADTTTASGPAPAADPSDKGDKSGKGADAKANAQAPLPTPKWRMTLKEAEQENAGCLSCHRGIEDMHNGVVNLTCAQCHGGNAGVNAQGLTKGTAEYTAKKIEAHVMPSDPIKWYGTADKSKWTAGNPERTYAQLVKENQEFIRFVNPGDLRINHMSCGTSECHSGDVHDVRKSMMTTGAMLWSAAFYNNGSVPFKNGVYGESYAPDGTPQRLQTVPTPTPEETHKKGILPYLEPLPRWEITQMGNILRTFERGGRKAAEIGNPLSEEVPGKPTQNTLSLRGLGTLLMTDPVFLGLQKTRLLDPMLHMLGSNDAPGDYRSSGCTGCHVVYANDRDWFHSGPFSGDKFGHTGATQTEDIALREARDKQEPGHPVRHQLTRAIPSSQCVVCHMHPGTLMLMTYYGTMWWDLESDGEPMYPAQQPKLSDEQKRAILIRNPEEASLRGKWGDPDFLKSLRDKVNPQLKHTQFADFNGHGWVYKNVFKRDRKGNLLDAYGNKVENASADQLKRAVEERPTGEAKAGEPVHLKDIHIEKGMHCVDCHFKQDNHGNGKLYSEPRNAIEIDCVDCHGTVAKRADPTSRDAKTTAAAGGNRMLEYRYVAPDGTDRAMKKDRFFKDKEGRVFQRSAVNKDLTWEVKQVADIINPGSPNYNEKAALAKTIMRDGKTWGAPASDDQLAHANSKMTCFTCHLSWTPSCFGCHLKMQANQQRGMIHNEGEEELRNWTSYNFQTLREDVYLLGKDGTVTGRRFAPVRSACAILVSSQNALREWLYSQQQTISAEGYSGQAFSSHFPHTVRTRETRGCSDCHLSENNDNNAYLAMTYMQGTNFYNWIGRFVYMAIGEEGFGVIAATERTEPQAVIGSYLHKMAFPDEYKKHKDNHDELKEFYEHPGNDITTALTLFRKEKTEVRTVQLRGEYLYAACGEGGFRVYDVANIDQKGFSERMTTAPFSPLGQKLHVKSKYATALASPTTLGVHPLRKHYPENEEAINRDDKQLIPLVYGFLYGTDKYEGLVVIGNPLDETKNGQGVATLLDGDPTNNFIKRALAWNPDHKLDGANNIILAGTYAYITADRGLFIVDLTNPLSPRIVKEIGEPFLKHPRSVQVQFRYAFVCDSEGVKVIDVTDPEKARAVEGGVVRLDDAVNIYAARTYAYVAAGKQGLVILDIENPEKPRIDQVYNAEGRIKYARDIKLGMTNVSLYAYIADGDEAGHGGGHGGEAGEHKTGEHKDGNGNGHQEKETGHKQEAEHKQEGGHEGGHGEYGLRIVQLISPEETPGHFGFSPRPTPKLVAVFHTHAPALAISEGIDRDRAVDETGNQLSVFGRRGARPLNQEETRRMYMRGGELWRVPEIRDNNVKLPEGNKDIRRVYGPPKLEGARQNDPKASPKPEKKADESTGQTAPSPPSNLLDLAPLGLPLIFGLFRRRRRGVKRKS
jgi:hypothetical protein